MGRGTVGVGVDGDRPQAERGGGTDDPAGDLTAIGDQQGVEHDGGSSGSGDTGTNRHTLRTRYFAARPTV
jgi:hypothetical protein